MELNYIIVQAGGKGTRMEHLTKNKPKSLVPINNLPMLFHLFRKYPEKKFIIIGDYKYEVMKKYLDSFADVTYLLVDARGHEGTCAGIRQALDIIPKNNPFLLIWSDLILPDNFLIPAETDNYLGLSGDFVCRWKYEDHRYAEEESIEHGVAGLFIFKDKTEISHVPSDGEFVKWLQSEEITPKELLLSKTKEYGLLSEYNKLQTNRCRPFNRMIDDGNKIIKEGIDEQGKKLAIREKNWYKTVESTDFHDFPHIYSYEPFVMEKISGKNVFEYEFPPEERKQILRKIISMLQELHSFGSIPTDRFSMQEAYITKTFSRLSKIRDLIPFSQEKIIRVNGKECRNVFFYREELEKKLSKLPCDHFVLLHGDCTFSNLMLRDEDHSPLMIDPRGYFGFTEIYGDPAYDWAKLYYSIVCNYDRFNLKDFRLEIGTDHVDLQIASNGWEDMEGEFFSLLDGEVNIEQIKLINAVIWLSLTTYAWEDYDSICGAFYNGIYYLEDIL